MTVVAVIFGSVAILVPWVLPDLLDLWSDWEYRRYRERWERELS